MKRYHIEDRRITGYSIRWDRMGWICVAQDREKWRDFVNTIMNLLVL
jgi:hypothetical protein